MRLSLCIKVCQRAFETKTYFKYSWTRRKGEHVLPFNYHRRVILCYFNFQRLLISPKPLQMVGEYNERTGLHTLLYLRFTSKVHRCFVFCIGRTSKSGTRQTTSFGNSLRLTCAEPMRVTSTRRLALDGPPIQCKLDICCFNRILFNVCRRCFITASKEMTGRLFPLSPVERFRLKTSRVIEMWSSRRYFSKDKKQWVICPSGLWTSPELLHHRHTPLAETAP